MSGGRGRALSPPSGEGESEILACVYLGSCEVIQPQGEAEREREGREREGEGERMSYREAVEGDNEHI